MQSLIRDSHAYEETQVRPEEWASNIHGPDFGTMLRAVDTNMRHLTGLRARHPRERRYQAYEC